MEHRRSKGLEGVGSLANALLGPQGNKTPAPQLAVHGLEMQAGDIVSGLTSNASKSEIDAHAKRIRAARVQAHSEERVVEWLEKVGVGGRLSHLSHDSALVPDACRFWVEHRHQGASMILGGTYGSGKTAAAVWCLRQVYGLGEQYNGPTTDWRWRPERTLFAKARDLYAAVFTQNRQLLGAARTAQVLVLDDWGATYQHEWPLYEIDGLLDARWERGLPTIMTTNVHPTAGEDCLAKTIPRTLDRMCDTPGPGLVPMVRESMRAGHGLVSPKAKKRGTKGGA